MTHFVRTTGGLLQLKSSAVNHKDMAEVLKFAKHLGFEDAPKKRLVGTATTLAKAKPIARKYAAREELQDLQAKEPEAFR